MKECTYLEDRAKKGSREHALSLLKKAGDTSDVLDETNNISLGSNKSMSRERWAEAIDEIRSKGEEEMIDKEWIESLLIENDKDVFW